MGNHGKSMEIPHEWAFNGIYINEKTHLGQCYSGISPSPSRNSGATSDVMSANLLLFKTVIAGDSFLSKSGCWDFNSISLCHTLRQHQKWIDPTSTRTGFLYRRYSEGSTNTLESMWLLVEARLSIPKNLVAPKVVSGFVCWKMLLPKRGSGLNPHPVHGFSMK